MADLSPELASRIQQLESSYADNPGRYFVALAGAWREAGETGRAEEILRENLKRFSGLSAHVLLGRCLADRGAYQEAANEFHYVLSVDQQNLIALRTLAEMAAAQGRRDEARRWYGELLGADPMNAEARQALAQLEKSAADAATADQSLQLGSGWGGADEASPPAGAASESAYADAPSGEFGMIDLGAPAAPAPPAPAASVEEWGAVSLDAEPSSPPAAPEPAGDFDAFGFGSVSLDDEPQSASPETAAEANGGWLEIDADARQDVGESAAADGPPPLASDEGAGTDLPLLDFDAGDFGGDEDERDADGTDLPLLDLADEPPAAEPHDDGEMVTETLAELYAAQGLHQQAAEAYRTLIQRRGEEPGLVRRLGEIEAQLADSSPSLSYAADSVDSDEDEDGTPSWLESVDAFARGDAPSAAAGPADVVIDAEESGAVEQAAEWADADAEDPLASLELAPGFANDAPADPFADSFAGGFEGGDASVDSIDSADAVHSADSVAAADSTDYADSVDVIESDDAARGADFDLIVVSGAEEVHIAASAEDVAEMSADWPVAAAPLDDALDQEEAVPPSIPASQPTMRGYFASLLAWTPGASASYEASVDAGDPVDAAEPVAGVETMSFLGSGGGEEVFDAIESPAPEADEAEPTWAVTLDDGALTIEAADDVPSDDVPSFESTATAEDAVAANPESGDAAGPDEPWAMPAAPSSESAGAEPWAADAAPEARSGDDGLLPWEVPAEPQPAESASEAPAATNADLGGFSFEDFFAGAPGEEPPAPAEAPAAPAPALVEDELPTLELVDVTEDLPAAPSAFAAPTPPPAFEMPAPPAAAPASPAAAGEEGDEDLESFQAWLQSLKR